MVRSARRGIGRGSARRSNVLGMCPERASLPISTPGLSHAPGNFGRPSQPQAHLAVGGSRESAAAFPLQAQPGAGPSVKPGQPNNSASAALVKNPEPSSSTGGPPTAPLSSNNRSKNKANSVPNGPNGKVSTPATTQVQINGAARLVRSAASAAIVEAVHAHLNGDSSLATRDRNEFVREVLSLIQVRSFPSSFVAFLFISRGLAR